MLGLSSSTTSWSPFPAGEGSGERPRYICRERRPRRSEFREQNGFIFISSTARRSPFPSIREGLGVRRLLILQGYSSVC